MALLRWARPRSKAPSQDDTAGRGGPWRVASLLLVPTSAAKKRRRLPQATDAPWSDSGELPPKGDTGFLDRPAGTNPSPNLHPFIIGPAFRALKSQPSHDWGMPRTVVP